MLQYGNTTLQVIKLKTLKARDADIAECFLITEECVNDQIELQCMNIYL